MHSLVLRALKGKSFQLRQHPCLLLLKSCMGPREQDAYIPSSQFCQVILEKSLFLLISQWTWGWAARYRALLPALSSCFTGTPCFLGLAPVLLCTNFIGFSVSACCFPGKARGGYYMRGNLHESFQLVAHLKRTSKPKLKTWLWKSKTEQCSVHIVSVQEKAARVLSKERIPDSVQIRPKRTKNLTGSIF